MPCAFAQRMRVQVSTRKKRTMRAVEARGRGRPALPAGEARDARVVVRLNEADESMLEALCEALGTDRAGAMREALRALHARKVRS